MEAAEWPGAERLAGLRAEVAAAAGGRAAAAEVAVAAAPFRVCPLGAHVDHQGGLTTAVAIDRGVLLAFLPAPDGAVRVTSSAFAGQVAFSAREPVPPRGAGRQGEAEAEAEEGEWGNYVRGAAVALQVAGHRLERGVVGRLWAPRGMAGGGLSSSAAVGVACLLALEHANGLEVDDRENIDLDRRIENDYIGLRNGILDQTAIIWSRRNRLTLIDCKGGRHRRVPKDAEVDVDAHPIAGCAWVLAYSGVEAPLQASSLFNDRVQQCQDAARALLDAARPGWASHAAAPAGAEDGAGTNAPGPAGHSGREEVAPILSMVTEAEWEQHAAAALGPEDAPLRRRAAHYFGEQRRVRAGLAAWEAGDLVAFGRLITESGDSFVHNFEVGAPAMADLRQLLLAQGECRGLVRSLTRRVWSLTGRRACAHAAGKTACWARGSAAPGFAGSASPSRARTALRRSPMPCSRR